MPCHQGLGVGFAGDAGQEEAILEKSDNSGDEAAVIRMMGAHLWPVMRATCTRMMSLFVNPPALCFVSCGSPKMRPSY